MMADQTQSAQEPQAPQTPEANTAPDWTRARQGFSGKQLTDSQFVEAQAIATILHREIQKSGNFIEKLTDYSHAFARSQRFDAGKAEIAVRDVFRDGYGQTMNQMREKMLAEDDALKRVAKDQALHHARTVPDLIRSGETMPYYQAQDLAAQAFARQHGGTETGAKHLMHKTFEQEEGRDLYAAGKEAEEAHHVPVRQARKAERRAEAQARQPQIPPRRYSASRG